MLTAAPSRSAHSPRLIQARDTPRPRVSTRTCDLQRCCAPPRPCSRPCSSSSSAPPPPRAVRPAKLVSKRRVGPRLWGCWAVGTCHAWRTRGLAGPKPGATLPGAPNVVSAPCGYSSPCGLRDDDPRAHAPTHTRTRTRTRTHAHTHTRTSSLSHTRLALVWYASCRGRRRHHNHRPRSLRPVDRWPCTIQRGYLR